MCWLLGIRKSLTFDQAMQSVKVHGTCAVAGHDQTLISQYDIVGQCCSMITFPMSFCTVRWTPAEHDTKCDCAYMVQTLLQYWRQCQVQRSEHAQCIQSSMQMHQTHLGVATSLKKSDIASGSRAVQLVSTTSAGPPSLKRCTTSLLSLRCWHTAADSRFCRTCTLPEQLTDDSIRAENAASHHL